MVSFYSFYYLCSFLPAAHSAAVPSESSLFLPSCLSLCGVLEGTPLSLSLSLQFSSFLSHSNLKSENQSEEEREVGKLESGRGKNAEEEKERREEHRERERERIWRSGGKVEGQRPSH